MMILSFALLLVSEQGLLMSLSDSLHERACPVCQSTDDSQVAFKENIDESKLDNLAFASRKIPELMNFKLIICPNCDLLYTPSPPSNEFLQKAYHETGYDSDEEAHYAARSYAYWLKNIVSSLPDREASLEIGSGNGAFLTHLLNNNFTEVIGVEPSLKAISEAPEHLKNHIRVGMFNAKNFFSQSF